MAQFSTIAIVAVLALGIFGMFYFKGLRNDLQTVNEATVVPWTLDELMLKLMQYPDVHGQALISVLPHRKDSRVSNNLDLAEAAYNDANKKLRARDFEGSRQDYERAIAALDAAIARANILTMRSEQLPDYALITQ